MDITKVALGHTVDEQGFSLITLSTYNQTIFNQIRENIRNYRGIDGYVLETFSGEEFMEKKTITIYIPRRFDTYVSMPPYACFPFPLIQTKLLYLKSFLLHLLARIYSSTVAIVRIRTNPDPDD